MIELQNPEKQFSFNTDIDVPESFSKPFEDIFWKKIDEGCETESSPDEKHFVLRTDGSTAPVTDLASAIDEVRNMYVAGDLRLRGTTQAYMEEAKGKGLLSAKTVDEKLESDVGQIASYRIPMSAGNIGNEEFLYRLSLTAMGSMNWGFRHGFAQSTLFGRFRGEAEGDGLNGRLDIAKMMPEDDLPELVLFRNGGRRAGIGEREYARQYYARNPTASTGASSYLANGNYAEVDFLGKMLRPFAEVGYQGDNAAKASDASYIQITRTSLERTITEMGRAGSREQRLFESIAKRLRTDGIPENKVFGPAFENTVKFILSEKVAYLLLRTIRDIS
ncbi:hypothetical protein HY971_04720 [Candidatus Kaiserbacteria bacterium]|nr:hypothetical protein [Candidatus Kaiserbacteria bacterium]